MPHAHVQHIAEPAVLLSIAAMVQGQDNGGALEVPKGDLHINLGEAGSKVFVSIQGGPEIELFDLAARVKALEDAAGSVSSSYTVLLHV